MDATPINPTVTPPRTYPFSNPAFQQACNRKSWLVRKARKQAEKDGRRSAPLTYFLPAAPGVQSEASHELLPRILADEIAFRSLLLERVQRVEAALLDAIDRELYDAKRASLPQIAIALCRVVELTDRIVERAKALDLSGTGKTQVSGLFARYAVLQQALRQRGLLTSEGSLVASPEPPGEPTGASREEARTPGASESELAQPEGVS